MWQTNDLNDIYALRANLEEFDLSYKTLFSKLGKDFKCEQGFTLYGSSEEDEGKGGVCIDNKVLTFMQPVTQAKISNSNADPDYTGVLVGKNTNFYWGFNLNSLPFVDFLVKGGSFCSHTHSDLFKDWPLFKKEDFFYGIKELDGNNPWCNNADNKLPYTLGSLFGEKDYFQANLKSADEYKMSLISSNDVKYERSLVKLVTFSPECAKEFDKVIKPEDDRSSRSIEYMVRKLKKVRIITLLSFVICLFFVMFAFIVMALIFPKFTTNVRSKSVRVAYLISYCFYFPALVCVFYLVIEVLSLISSLNSIHKKKCASPVIAGDYFKASADNNFSIFVSYLLTFMMILGFSLLDIFFYLKFERCLDETTDPER
jgi:hypothetical protein